SPARHTQLEATLDLAERRRIRSAIRELQRQELERDEEVFHGESSLGPGSPPASAPDNKCFDAQPHCGLDRFGSRHLEEEQKAALAALSQQLEAITDVEELTKLLRAAGEYEERKLIRAAIRKLRAEEIEAATLAENMRSSQRDGSEPPAVPGHAKSSQRDDAETKESHRGDAELPALAQSRETCDKGSSKPLAAARSGEISQKNDSEQLELAGPGKSSHGGCVEQSPAQEPKGSVVSVWSAPGGLNPGPLFCHTCDCNPSPASCLVTAALPHPLPRIHAVTPLTCWSRGIHAVLVHPIPTPAVPALDPALPACRRGWLGMFLGLSLTPGGLGCSCSAAESALPWGGGMYAAGTLPGAIPWCGAEPARLGQIPHTSCLPCRGDPRATEYPHPYHHCPQKQQQQHLQHQHCQQQCHQGECQEVLCATGLPFNSLEIPCVANSMYLPCQHFAHRWAPGPVQPGVPMQPLPAEGLQQPPVMICGDILATRLGAVRDCWALPRQGVPWGGCCSPLLCLGYCGCLQHPTSLYRMWHVFCRVPTACGTGQVSGPWRLWSLSKVVEKPKAPRRVVEQPQAPRLEPELPNGMEKVQVRELERRSKLNVEELNRIEDEDVLDKMLDQTTDFEERRLIRNAMRELRQRKRDQREKERDQRLQETRSQATAGRAGHATETTTTQSMQSADGSAHSTITKTERLVQSSDGSKTSRTTTMESSYSKRSDNGNSTFVQTKSSYSSSSKKMGSIFDREDESASRQSSLAALERRQAEKKKELMKAQSLPKTSASQARKAMMEKLQKESGSLSNPSAGRQTTVQRSSSFGVPNANSIKQMLLDWCRAKTRGYEHVDIQNFSSSWSDGMAFCALVHNFFPDAFDYSQLTPQNRRHNFEVAFSSAEKHADCPQLLDVEDMVRMREPDWKCVYTYIQEFYRCLVQKGLVKTKKS
ncbi:Smoothelin, partial [Calypte anna]